MDITHDYVDYETAKLLCDLGWTQITDRYYTNIWGQYCLVTHETFKGLKEGVSAPEHWQVCKWLRLKYNIWISCIIRPNFGRFHCEIREACADGEFLHCTESFGLPEEAELEAIKYCLNNLIDGK